MKFISAVLGSFLGCGLFASMGIADFVLSIDSSPPFPKAFQTNSGIQSINVFAMSNTLDAGITLTAGFSLGGGAVFATPNAGTFGGAGLIGSGNINLAGSSFLRNPGDPTNAALSIEFNSPQTVPANNTPIATLRIDTTNLAAGRYAINITRTNFGGNAGTFSSGSFDITAVPEPASLLNVALSMSGLWYGRRRLTKRVLTKLGSLQNRR